MIGGSTPEGLAARFTGVAQMWVVEGPSERAERARRQLLSAISAHEPATLNQVAKAVHRGAPAVSRSVDTLVRAGLVERTQDPDNRRRLALRLTEAGRERLSSRTSGSSSLQLKLERLANSELRAVERAIEILERGL
jgi:DNA-binding MarR family transcriptional regulator